ncbi:urease accessory protein UreE [Marinomonas algicola]|jgi:urease accessory protein|uniref:urease accessory protein UreE n=1 Tax=Marinomonas algicola TaxID=2773454 RepID=UPI00174CAFB4|nr:urease accessory protein UreE [Marinomonas algicola]
MIDIYERLGTHCHETVYTSVTLTHEQRDRGRLKLTGANGEEVRVFLERGKPLLVGEYLLSNCGKYIKIEGAVEEVVQASCEDWVTFSKACYHLGNRHVKISVGERSLTITPDHVLEEMLVLLGLTVSHVKAVFIPESGAYSHGHNHH